MIKKLIKNIFKKKYEMKDLISGIGESEIFANTIFIKNYPFEPSIAFQKKEFKNSEIESICLDASPHYFKVKNDLIFVTTENKIKLSEFAKRNKIKVFKQTWNWDKILQPFLDMEFDETDKAITLELLNENGINEREVKQIRKEVEKQMYKYNFDTMLWEWCSLGLSDVLSAMRVKYSSIEFKEFYKRAMEIELRVTPHSEVC